MTPVEVSRGEGPIVLGMPHTGLYLPSEVQARLNDRGRALSDTDWHIERLYSGLSPDVTQVRALFHRYVIDANRDPGGTSLYPGQNTTGLIPLIDFDGQAIWTQEPGPEATAQALQDFHHPYHKSLADELARVRSAHGVAILIDCHSIRSRIPYLFEGRLADFNIGTNDGASCAASVLETLQAVCHGARGYSTVTNGRFKGGWTTRHHGRPETGIHAVQMEIAQSAYLSAEAPPWDFDVPKAERLRPHLQDMIEKLAKLAPNLKGTQ